MRRRTIVIGFIAIVALLAGTVYVGNGLFLRAQFGRSVYGLTPEVMDALCNMPLIDGEPISESEYSNDVVRLKRGPFMGPGCMIRDEYSRVESCQPEACDGTRNRVIQRLGDAWQTEIGACAFPFYSEARDCALIPDDTAIKYGEYCPQSGTMSKNIVACCLEGDYVDSDTTQTATRTCAPGLVCSPQYSAESFNNTVCSCPSDSKWDTTKEVCVPIDSTKPFCGNGIKETGEECDDGTKNVPTATANKSWLDITKEDTTVLARSSCLDSCKLAQCSDKKDNDKRNGIDGNDAACRDGAFGNGSTTLIGYNVEQCPMCQLDEEKDETIAVDLDLPVNTLTAAVRQNDVALDVPNLDQQYCRGSYKTTSGTSCECSSSKEVCFAEHEVDADGTIVALGECECKPLNPPPDMQTWTWACNKDKDCSLGYRCAYYSTYKHLIGSGGQDVDIYRCKKLIEDGEEGCRSRWDCESRYTDTTQVNAKGVLERDNSARTKCLEINRGTPRCCNPDAKDPKESCIRPNLAGSATAPIPNFAQCQTGGGAGNFAGGDGGWDSGDGSGGGGGGGDRGDGGGDGGASSSSSSAQCNIYNPCIALTNSPTPGTYAYTMPAACPLMGNKRTCYARCIADINTNGVFQNCDSRCSASELDLNMCACNEGFSDCTISCGNALVQCNNGCSYDSNPTACRTECREGYRSCLNSCGRMCPTSGGSSSRVSNASKSTGSNESEHSSASHRSSASSSLSLSRPSSQQNSSNPNNSQGSSANSQNSSVNKSSQDSKRSSASSKNSVSSISQKSSNHSDSSSNSHSSTTSNQSSKSSSVSSSLSKSSGSHSSVTCIDEGTVPQMRVLFSKVESTNPNVTLEQRVYIDGIYPHMVNDQAETIAAGTWFAINSIDTQDFVSIYDGPHIVRNDVGDPDVTSVNFSVRPASWVRGGIEKGTDNTYDTWYGTLEFRGVSVTDAYCLKGSYVWACPEQERDGVVLAPDNDEVWVENGVVHFALHTKNVSNIDGRSDQFGIYFKPLPTCPVSSSNSSQSSKSSQSSRSSSFSAFSSSSSRSSSIRSSSRESSMSSSSSSSSSSGNTGGMGGTFGNTGIGGSIGGTVTGIGGGVGGVAGYSSRSFYGYNSSSGCGTDRDCPLGTRCILSRCLTVTDIAQLPAFCGNARIDAGEICDNGADNSNNPNAYCRPDCTLGRCGDAIVDTPLEQCDDGNGVNNDGCSSLCQPERGAPSTALPATTIELPFTNKGDIGPNDQDIGGGGSGVNGGNIDASNIPSTPDTGPAALAVMIAGGAAGWLYRRRK